MFKKVLAIQILSILILRSSAQTTLENLRIPVYENTSSGNSNPLRILLYKIETGDLTLPIYLNYDASGVKYTDEISIVGLKWDIDFGPSINRKVNCIPDEQPSLPATAIPEYWKYFNDISSKWGGWLTRDEFEYPLTAFVNKYTPDNNPSTLYIKTRAIYNVFDIMPDEFNYNVGGTSGKFFFTRNGIVKQLFENGCKIEHNILNTNDTIPFIITKSNGTRYYFINGIRKYTAKKYADNRDYESMPPDYTSTYTVSKIENVKNSNSITFFYENELDNKISYDKRTSTDIYKIYELFRSTKSKIIKEIKSNKERILFEYIDYEDPRYAYVQLEFPLYFDLDKLIKKISILDNDNKLIRSYEFIYIQDYMRALLSEIIIKDSENKTYNFRKFDYHYRIEANLNQRDFFDYCNSNTKDHLRPMFWTNYDADRNFDSTKIISGALKSIIYPTGSKVNFYYKPKYERKIDNNGYYDFYCGGIEVSKIETRDRDNNVITTQNTDKQELIGFGLNTSTAPLEYYKIIGNSQTQPWVLNSFSVCVDEMTKPLEYSFKYNENDTINYMYNYGSFYKKEITQYGKNRSNGKEIVYFKPNKNSFSLEPKIIRQETYNDNGNLVKEIDYFWEDDLNPDSSILSIYPYDAYYTNSGLDAYTYILKPRPLFYNINERLKKVIKKEYFEDNSNTYEVKELFYNSQKNLISVKDSNNFSTSKKVIKYINDLELNPQSISNLDEYAKGVLFLKNKNINTPFEEVEITTKNGLQYVTRGKIYLFKENITKPVKELVLNLEFPILLEDFTFSELTNNQNLISLSYDARYQENSSFVYNEDDNLIQYKQGSNIISYKWNQKTKTKQAEASNALPDDWFIQDFEETPWNKELESNTARTGKYSTKAIYHYFGNKDTVTLKENYTYKLSAWTKKGTLTSNTYARVFIEGNGLSFNLFINPLDNNQWKYGEIEFSIPQGKGGKYNIYVLSEEGSGNPDLSLYHYMDDVRLSPINSKIESFTWETGFGLTSKTDANSSTIFFKYDGLGRIYQIVDEKGNVLKQYEYNTIELQQPY